MSDTDDHSSPTHAYASVDDSGLASQNVLSPSQVRRRVVQSSESFDEHQLEQGGMITIASFSQDCQAPTVLYDIGGNSATAFGPEQQSVDTVLKSSDAVFFYVHRHILDRSSENGFGAGNVGKSLIAIDDDAVTLNIILHAVYDRPSDKFSPTVLQLIRAVDRMPIYGISVPQLVQQTSNLFTLLSSMTNLNPMDIYALAAYHSLDALAILASSHLLLFNLSSLPEETIDRIGGQYLKRLSELQMSRNQDLMDILARAPPFADECPADPCGAWAFAGFSVLKIMNPGLSPMLLDATMRPLADNIHCASCKEIFSDAVKDAVKQWSMVKATI